MKKTLIYFLILSLSLINFSCNKIETFTKAASEIGKEFETSNVIVGNKSGLGNTDEDSGYTIDIKNVKLIEEKNYPLGLVASVSAKILYDNLTEEQRKREKQIIVNIESTSINQEFKFPIQNLRRIEPYISNSKRFISKIKTKEYEYMHENFVDHQYISKDIFFNEIINKVVLPNESVFEKMGDVKLCGFNFHKEQGISVVDVFSQTKSDKGFIYYQTVFTDSKKPKIVGFWIKG